MGEYSIDRLVNQLLKVLAIDEENAITLGPSLADQLRASVGRMDPNESEKALQRLRYVGTRDLRCQYDELKANNVCEVDGVVQLASRINEDASLRKMINMQHFIKQKLIEKNRAQQQSAESQRTQSSRNQGLPAVSTGTTPLNPQKKSRGHKNKSRRHDVIHQKMKAFIIENSFLSLDFKKIDWSDAPPVAPLGNLSIKDQELVLIDDLLYVLIGSEGRYIRMQLSQGNPNKHTIGVERGGDELVYTAATRILRICPLYSTIIHFAEDVNYGLVNQALAGCLRELIKEYLILVAEIEAKARRCQMTLQTMWLSLQSTYSLMEAVKHIVDGISLKSYYGGHTLSILHNRIANHTADIRTLEFCIGLMHTSSEDYFECLNKWLYMGVIEDPYGEFFIEDIENKTLDSCGMPLFHTISRDDPEVANRNESYWESRFTYDDSKVPEFLRSLQIPILKTGKYLSVVRQFGQKPFRPLDEFNKDPLRYTPELRVYRERIERANKYASRELLHLLMNETDLIGRLNSIKHYFLFDLGDFFIQFMDTAEEELSKSIEDINTTRLESLLELAVRTSCVNSDPYKDDVHVQLLPESLYSMMSAINNISADILSSQYPQLEQTTSSTSNSRPIKTDYCLSSSNVLKGWESITMSYDVKWPLSMVISKRCHMCYQMIFRHLFCCKYVERQLESTWLLNRTIPARGYERTFALRQKMLHFVHNLLYYTMIELIEPNFHTFITKISSNDLESVDEVIGLHSDFVTGILQDSMLTDTKLLEHVIKILLLCSEFSVLLEHFFTKQQRAKQATNVPTHAATNTMIDGDYVAVSSGQLARTSTPAKSPMEPGMTTLNMDSTQSFLCAEVKQRLNLTGSQFSEQSIIGGNTVARTILSSNVDVLGVNAGIAEFKKTISDMDERFTKLILSLLQLILRQSRDCSASSKLLNVVHRLNFNNFYSTE